MAYETIVWERSGAVGRLTLSRPDSLNAWTQQLGLELRTIIERDAAEESVRAVLITGAGRGFSSGADLKAGFDLADDGMPDIYKELHGLYHPAIAGLRRLAKPVIAAVNGPAVGIGCSLALACDLIMASESSFFGLAFVNIGLWQGAIRDANDPSHREVADAVRRREPVAVELLYSDQVGGQRTISRFSLVPFAREEDDQVSWMVSGTRHWYLDRAGPR